VGRIGYLKLFYISKSMPYNPTEKITTKMFSENRANRDDLIGYVFNFLSNLALRRGALIEEGFLFKTEVLAMQCLENGYEYLLEIEYIMPADWRR
jgi:hypothetical protein